MDLSHPPRKSRHGRLVLLLLNVPITLWVIALLFRFRIVNIFDAYLMKFPGPLVVFGAMFFCPVAALLLGVRMVRTRRAPVTGRMVTATGALLFISFIVYIGIPMLREAFTPGTPKNPSTPRPVELQVGLPVFPGAEGFGTRMPAGRGVVLDHVSASWSEDECVSTWYGAHDVTISWSIISEALNRSRHRKKTHSAGLLIGDGYTTIEEYLHGLLLR